MGLDGLLTRSRSAATEFARRSSPPAMTRCECANVRFEEIRKRMEKGAKLEDVRRSTGIGDMCTECLPDLRAFAARLRA
jgi:bacterioferritin-associated ferredoxin